MDAKALFEMINENTVPGIGITRPTYGGYESAAMCDVKRHAESLGLETFWDFAMNLHVRLPAPGGAPDIAFGSHLDSVPSGGRYDGTAGVVAGLLVLERALREKASPPHSLRLIVLRGEESAGFGKSYLGSLALFGKLPPAALDLKDRDDRALAHAIRSCAGDPARIAAGERILAPGEIARFYELHIEQGPVLEEMNLPIATVTGIRGNIRYPACTSTGETGHSGTTPQDQRKDAVLAFAEFRVAVQEECERFVSAGNDLVCNVGIAQTDPSTHAMSVIPGTMSFALEFRSVNIGVLRAFNAACVDAAVRISERRGVAIDLGLPAETEPVSLDRTVVDSLAVHSLAQTGKAHRIPSGAGHDAAVFQAEGIPTGMIFVRNQHGSHNPQEDMRLDDFALAVDLLYRAVTAP